MDEEFLVLLELSGDELEAALDKYNKRASEEAKKRNNASRHARRRAHELSCVGHYEEDDIEQIWDLQTGLCYFCEEKLGRVGQNHAFAKDHLIAVSDYSGTNWPHNIALACSSCNSDKQGRTERSYWNKLTKTHGKDWVQTRRERANQNKKAKKKLTDIRKKDRKAGINFLELEVAKLVEASLSDSQRHNYPPDIQVTDLPDSRHIQINLEEAAIACLGPRGGLKSTQVWFRRHGKSIVKSLVALDCTNPKRS